MVDAQGAGECVGTAIMTNDPYLAQRRIRIGRPRRRQRRRSVGPLFDRVEDTPAVCGLAKGLRRNRANSRPPPRHHRAYSKVACLHRNTDSPRSTIASDNRVRHGQSLSRVAST